MKTPWHGRLINVGFGLVLVSAPLLFAGAILPGLVMADVALPDSSIDDGGDSGIIEGGSNDGGPCTTSFTDACAPNGEAGCPGDFGTGGAGGLGGGASVALYISGPSQVTISGGGFYVGNGGPGGAGGGGGAGHSGTTGASGSNVNCFTSCSFACMPQNPNVLTGGSGGVGGFGGSGGQGGGGAGGPVYYYVHVNGAPAPTFLTKQFTLANSHFEGDAGKGGPPNGPDAPVAAETFP